MARESHLDRGGLIPSTGMAKLEFKENETRGPLIVAPVVDRFQSARDPTIAKNFFRDDVSIDLAIL